MSTREAYTEPSQNDDKSHTGRCQAGGVKKTLMMTAALVAAAVTLGACGTSTTSAGPSASTATTTTTQPATSAEHNHADEMFAQMMIPHHQQAIEMSDMVLGKQGVDPKVIALATQIKAAQGPEIQQMQGWLTQWGATAMSPSSGMPGMPGMSGMPGMPGMQTGQGMMSEQDMAALQNAQGVAASKLFLTQMIAHHQGAITMAETEIKTGQSPAAVALANSIKTSQQREIDTMKTLLGSL
ncbi:Uncharacterized conserved protein, DUF305 family [Mycolicibacterium fluoranthenivorans]|uniref:Uncharacterized conserved protein, DUF305 family n=2 Tax=Mycolicibacterium fluoranthenivorans TaxID=258505 RepID=A0A1G4WUB1_9MYCO|nr:Uncharacterized conserved protein, DUF305 family [Mycolicibacterium fluoranthenivorans]